MRVLIVTQVFPPDIGGPATFGARLAEELSRSSHAVKVVCSTADDKSGSVYPYKVIRVGLTGNTIQRELDIRLRLAIEIISADIVYCMGLEHQTSLVCRWLRKKYVLRIGGDSVWEGARNLGATDLEPVAYYTDTTPEQRIAIRIPELRRQNQLKGAQCVVYVSEYLQKLSRIWLPDHSHKEKIILNGVVATHEPEFSNRDENENLRLLFVGRQTNWKGVDSILLAIQHLYGIRLTIAGYGPEYPGNVDLAKKLKLEDKAYFIGHVQPYEILELMKRHDVLLLPSLYEGLSNTLLEAGVAGIACIASNRGGNPEVIIDHETGLLVNPFDIEQVKTAIKSLADNESTRIKLARNHYERVLSEFPLDKSVSETINVLERAVQG